MSLTVQLFSLLAERVGTRALEVDVSLPISASDLLTELARQHDAFSQFRGALRLAVNCEYADEGLQIRPGDEVAVITPTSGG